MSDTSIKLKERFEILNETKMNDKYFRIEVEKKHIPSIMEYCKHYLGYRHLSCITAIDYLEKGKIGLVYNLYSYETHELFSVKTYIDRDNAEIETIHKIYDPAIFFERDIFEMFGVVFKGHPNLTKFILDEWDGPPPMRKDFDTRKYVNENFEWKRYEPKWMEELGLKPEDLEGEELELL